MNRMRQVVGWMMILGSMLLSVYGLAGIAATPFATPSASVFGVVVGLLSLIAPMVATWSPRFAARIYRWLAPAGLLLVPSFREPFGYGIFGRNIQAWDPRTALTSAVVVFVGSLVVPWLFWRWAVRRHWPGVLATGSLSRFPHLLASVGSVMFIGAFLVAMLVALNLPWLPIVGDCGGRPLINEGVPFGVDFTATVLFVGPRGYRDQSLWSVVRVDHLYSESMWAMPRIVILRGGFRREDKARQYFVEGQRSHTPFGRFLPIIEPMDCGHTKPAEDAVVELRVLRDGAPKSGTRLIGQVYNGDRWRSASRTPVPGFKVSIEGPNGRVESITDSRGVYDVIDLPPGRYAIRSSTAQVAAIEAKSGDVHIANFYVP